MIGFPNLSRRGEIRQAQDENDLVDERTSLIGKERAG